ncbi:protein held out wings isoform X1 [Lepeophtheirus salmonis]|uniref:protein held out wings isoform X1 n=1 Tax=Lepeophtheirus salmonis TaxID=72036 RepID=UPI001AE4CC73|nr:protein held out wings-like isoform X1 [Lepeophtheirus salmonis]XP_040576378.1 protein held out wings-like isoform X1 [Lepeophtheirus salmonis]
MGDHCPKMNGNTQSIADYLAQLLKDKKQLAAFPNVFNHLERLLDEEISKVRGNLFQINGAAKEPLVLPDGVGPPITQSEKVYVPIKDYPDFNFVGRILGPRGMTTKQLEQETGCKIMVRGKGSMRDKKKEDSNRGKPNWEHLNDDLHVLITVEDSENRAAAKLQRAVAEVRKLLTVSEGEDELKKRQLMELAIINGTYRDSNSKTSSPGLDAQNRYLTQAGTQQALQTMVNQQNALRSAAPLGGAPLILSPRLQVPTTLSSAVGGLLNGSGGPPPLIAANDTQGLLYAQYAAAASDYANYPGLVSPLLATAEYADPTGVARIQAASAGGKKDRRPLGQSGQHRSHPYVNPRT